MEPGALGRRDVDQHGVSELEAPGGTDACRSSELRAAV